MKNYKDSDYALNKYRAGIVYRFADGIVEISLADYLAENPDKTDADFLELKALSDADYLEQAICENRQTYRNIPLDGAVLLGICSSPSVEGAFDLDEKVREIVKTRQLRLAQAAQILSKLTEAQRRRFLLHKVDGLTTREIANREQVKQRTIMDSLELAEKKIKKYSSSEGKKTSQNG